MELLHREQSAYGLLEFFKHSVYGNQLYIDSDLQISESDDVYNRIMVEPFVGQNDIKRIVVLGGGDGGVRLAALRDTAAYITTVEINQRVPELCKTYLPRMCGDPFKSNSRSELVIAPALDYLGDIKGIDGIIYDLTFEPFGCELPTSREEFADRYCSKIYEALRPGGVLSMQVSGSLQPADKLTYELTTCALEKYFGNPSITAVRIPSYEEDWFFAHVCKR